MRINAYLAACKLGSRRKVEELINQNRVVINGVQAKLASTVNDGDIVCVDGKQVLVDNDKVYYILNKPIGYLCTVSDDRNRPTVLDIVKDKEHRIFPVGRLDYNTEGLIILTNDGAFANRVIHPSSNISKTYEFITRVRPTSKQLSQLRAGICLDDGDIVKAQVEKPIQCDGGYSTKISIHEGKNREIRKMCKAVGLHIVNLKRLSIGGLSLGDLAIKKYKKVDLSDLDCIFTK